MTSNALCRRSFNIFFYPSLSAYPPTFAASHPPSIPVSPTTTLFPSSSLCMPLLLPSSLPLYFFLSLPANKLASLASSLCLSLPLFPFLFVFLFSSLSPSLPLPCSYSLPLLLCCSVIPSIHHPSLYPYLPTPLSLLISVLSSLDAYLPDSFPRLSLLCFVLVYLPTTFPPLLSFFSPS